MKCRELTEFIMAYLDCELDDATRRTFEFHLSMCPACMAFMDTYKKTVALGRESFACPSDKPAEAHVPEALIQAIIAATKVRNGTAQPPGATN